MSVSNAAKLHEIFSPTKKLDQVLLSPLFGLPLFFLIMATLFSSIFWLAKPFMDLFDFAFSSLQSGALAVLPTGLFSDFLANGIIASFGSVAVFIPQIYILFFGIGILESSGYLARASTLVDRPFSKIGLSGRSFVPLLSGFACAVPALMATRNISSPRDRWITNFIIPLMTCSARLPVYALLLGFLFHDSPAWVAGLWLAGLYFLSLFVGVLAAALLNRFLAKDKMSFFMMELPLYRKPRLRVLFKQSFERTKNYAVKAGPVIFTFAVLIWLGTSFPNYQAATAQEKLQTSYFAKAGQYAEPIFKPMGVDWRVGVGLMSAFAAREVFVSSLALVFNIDAGDKTNELSQSHSLQLAMREAKSADGTPIFTTASVCGLILFFMIALQCMSTFSVAIRETRSWKLPVAQLVFFNLIAYGLAVSVVQIHNFLAR